MEFAHAYLHGFASGPMATKGLALARQYEEAGLVLHRPDLNRPSFAELTYDAALAEIDALDRRHGEGRRWRLIGSSMGGYLAARWAELHPGRVDRLLLLCPGFGLAERWGELLGERAMGRWEREGSLDFADGAGRLTAVHWGFVQNARAHASEPRVTCPTTIVHGTNDVIVPIGLSRAYAKAQDNVALVEVDDEHTLVNSLPRVHALVRQTLLPGPPSA